MVFMELVDAVNVMQTHKTYYETEKFCWNPYYTATMPWNEHQSRIK